MMLRFWLFVALVSCAVLVVRAQEEDEEAAVHDVATLAERGGYQSNSGRGNGNGNKNDDDDNAGKGGKSQGGGNSRDNNDDDNGKGGKSQGGNGKGDDNEGSQGGRGSRGASQEEIQRLIGRGRRNRYINKGTRYLGTKKSYSESSNVVKSRKDNYYRKNFVNEVVSNLRLLRKKVNVHKHITYKRPLTVDNIKVHQQTNYIENVYPQLNKLYVKEHGTVIQPARLITIQRSQDSSRRHINHRLQVNSASRRVNLGTRFQRTRFLAVKNLGDEGFGGGSRGSQGNGRGNGNGRGEGNGWGNGKGRGSGGNKGGNGGAYGGW